MARYEYTLRIEAPDELEPETLEQIAAEAQPQDGDPHGPEATLRWLGAIAQFVEDRATEELPEGWYVKVEGGIAQPSLLG
jgi:hypothetical protein